MLEELLSSAVEMALSVEEKEALLRRGGKKEECIVDKIRQRISVPVSLLGNRKVVIYGKPKETKEAKEIFKGRVSLFFLFFHSPVGHNIWWENSRNRLFGPKNDTKVQI